MSGYVLDTEYPVTFISRQCPVQLNFTAVLNGIEPPVQGRRFTYAGLGCGKGFTIAALAAMYPQATFYAVDFNPVHTDFLSRLAHDAGLTNLTVLTASFGPDLPIPDATCDYVAAHGVVSYLNDAVRQDFLQTVERITAPGGLAYISYNALPGWTEQLILRDYLLRVSNTGARQDGTRGRAVTAVDALRRADDPEVQAFLRDPRLSKTVADLLKQPPEYVVHEYFHDQLQVFRAADFFALMRPLGFSFVGSADVRKNLPSLMIDGAAGFLPPLLARDTWESTVDTIFHRLFRTDVFIRAETLPHLDDRRDRLRERSIALVKPKAMMAAAAAFDTGTVDFRQPIYQDIAEGLSGGLASIRDLTAAPSCAGYSEDDIEAAVLQLMAADQVAPAVTTAPLNAYDSVGRFNEAVLKHLWTPNGNIHLASPETGLAHPFSPLEALIYKAVRTVPNAPPTELAETVLNDIQGRGLVIDGSGDTGVLASLIRAIEAFSQTRKSFIDRIDQSAA